MKLGYLIILHACDGTNITWAETCKYNNSFFEFVKFIFVQDIPECGRAEVK